MVSKRMYWPAFMADEGMPDGRDDPTAWLDVRDGEMLFGSLEEEGDICFSFKGLKVAIGDVVDVVWHDFLGEREVEFAADKTFVVSGGAPEGFTHCWDRHSWESGGDNLQDIADNLQDFDFPSDGGPARLTIRFARWGEEKRRVVLVGRQAVLAPIQAEA